MCICAFARCLEIISVNRKKKARSLYTNPTLADPMEINGTCNKKPRWANRNQHLTNDVVEQDRHGFLAAAAVNFLSFLLKTISDSAS